MGYSRCLQKGFLTCTVLSFVKCSNIMSTKVGYFWLFRDPPPSAPAHHYSSYFTLLPSSLTFITWSEPSIQCCLETTLCQNTLRSFVPLAMMVHNTPCVGVWPRCFFASNLSSFSFDAILKFNEKSEPYFHFKTFQFYSKEASYSVPKSLLKRNFHFHFLHTSHLYSKIESKGKDKKSYQLWKCPRFSMEWVGCQI